MSEKSSYYEYVTAELEKANINFDIEQGSKHTMLVWTGANGRSRKFPLKRNKPCDNRSIKNACCQVKRLLREDKNII